MSISNLIKFHEKIGAFIGDKPTKPETDYKFTRVHSVLRNAADSVIHEHEALRTGPSVTGPGLAILRVRLMIEELAEVAEAMVSGDLVALADGLADLEYVVQGTAVSYGIPLDHVHEIVHASNMSKTGQDEHSKGGKGAGYVPPMEAIKNLLEI